MIHVEQNVALAPLTTLGVGGPARFFTRVCSEAEVIEALAWARESRIETFVLGGGSNLVIADRGLDALVIHAALRGIAIDRRSNQDAALEIAAGETWDDVVALAVREGLAGIECLSGIPGLTGATPIQNVGAYGQEISDVTTSVSAIDRASSERVEMAAAECEFAYRDSFFKRLGRGRFFVTSLRMQLSAQPPRSPRYAELERALAGGPLSVARIRETVLSLRRSKAMVLEPHAAGGSSDSRSVGSFFMNPIVEPEIAAAVEVRARASGALRDGESMPRFDGGDGKVKLAAGWLIERAGFAKGTTRGTVGLSSKHALAIVNRGGASASDVVAFARQVQAGVEAAFSIRIANEPELVGFEPNELLERADDPIES